MPLQRARAKPRPSMLARLCACFRPGGGGSTPPGPATPAAAPATPAAAPAAPGVPGAPAAPPAPGAPPPAADLLEALRVSVERVRQAPASQQYAMLQELDVLAQMDKVLDALEAASSVAGQATEGVVKPLGEVWEKLVTASEKLLPAGTALAQAGAAAAYVGPAFALAAYALKQWSSLAALPAKGVAVLRSCRALLGDLLCAWPRLQSSGPEAEQRLQLCAKQAAEAVQEVMLEQQGNRIARFFVAQASTAELADTATRLSQRRQELNTQLLLALIEQERGGARAALAVGDVFGVEQQEAELAAWLLLGSPLNALWLHGMGGCGKTTMARLLFNRAAAGRSHLPGFEHRAFVELDSQDGSNEQARQARLASVLKQLGAQGFNQGSSAAELLGVLQEHVRDKAVLLVLDNVWRPEQLDELLLDVQLGRGSQLIITSRLDELPESDAYRALHARLRKHELKLLAEDAARQVFRAQLSSSPPPELLDVEAAIVAACGGLPLALRIAGGQLWKSTSALRWREVHRSLVQGAQLPNRDSDARLRGVLTASFEGLSAVAQNMLLDVVSVLHGRDVRLALAVWRRWWPEHAGPEGAWDELQRRALVSVDAKQRLRVHDVIRALGRRLITDRCSSFFGSRAWIEPDGRLVDFGEGTRQPLVALSLEGSSREARARLEALGDTSDLRLCFSEQLAWWPAAAGGQLLWLEAGSWKVWGTISDSAVDWLQQADLRELVVLRLEHSLQLASLPESFGQLAALQHFSCCSQLASLPESFGQLAALQELHLSGCSQLASLPESFGQLAALQHLDLSWCSQLANLPESFGQLAALQYLNLSGCLQLASLPESFGQLAALQHLDLSWCEQLASLPESFGQQTALQHLDLRQCSQLASLPESFGQLAALQQLDMHRCEQLASLPASFGQLAALQDLDLSWCLQLASLPESFGQLAVLQQLDLSGCSQLTSLPESFGQLAALQHSDLHWCSQLTSLPESFGQLAALQQLDLHRCEQLASLPESFGQLAALQQLDLSWCLQLASLPESFRQLAALQHVDISGCSRLDWEPSPGSFGRLEALLRPDLRDTVPLG